MVFPTHQLSKRRFNKCLAADHKSQQQAQLLFLPQRRAQAYRDDGGGGEREGV